MPDQGFEAESHGFCIGRRATRFLRVVKGGLINVERLFHTFDVTIPIQQKVPYGAARGSAPFENCDNTLTLAEEAGIGSSDIAKIEVAGTPVEKVRLAFRDQR